MSFAINTTGAEVTKKATTDQDKAVRSGAEWARHFIAVGLNGGDTWEARKKAAKAERVQAKKDIEASKSPSDHKFRRTEYIRTRISYVYKVLEAYGLCEEFAADIDAMVTEGSCPGLKDTLAPRARKIINPEPEASEESEESESEDVTPVTSETLDVAEFMRRFAQVVEQGVEANLFSVEAGTALIGQAVETVGAASEVAA